MTELRQAMQLRIYLRLLRRYGEEALTRRIDGTWLPRAVEARVLYGRTGPRGTLH